MWIVADVVFDTDADAREAERLAREGKLAGVSVDLGDVTSELEILEVDDDGFPIDWMETVTDAEVIGATQVAMPAFADAKIEFGPDGPVAMLAPEGLETSDRRVLSPGALRWRDPAPLMFNDSSDGHNGAIFVGNLTNFRRSLVAMSAVPEIMVDPKLPTLTKPLIDGGRLSGHGAGWGTCHTAFKNACVTAPRSMSEYAYCEGGAPIYRHPNGDHHAPLSLEMDSARAWYETHCELVGLAGVGEDDSGIWVSGPTSLDDGDIFLSGDWRNIDGNLELIAFLVVDNPGFPTALVASETQMALTAAGIVTETDRIASLERRIRELEMTTEANAILASVLA
jgi:hypothetical protein